MRVAVTVGNVDETNVRQYTAEDPAEGYSIAFGMGVWKGELERSATFALWTEDRAAATKFVARLAALAFYNGEDAVLVEEDGSAWLLWSDHSTEVIG